jgi:hypothetical protein
MLKDEIEKENYKRIQSKKKKKKKKKKKELKE